MSVLKNLQPESVFSWFEQLCAIPHGSRNTKAVSDWLAGFAADRGLECVQDSLNNIIIFGPASSGYEEAEPVILQGHMDMVCEKAPDCELDMEKDGLTLAVEGDTVLAKGTTLGGDDGIAVAMMLALLDDDSLPHPPLECVFTVDEEIGMLGAMDLDVSSLRGRRMLNMDSEAEGIFTVSCAGGRVVTSTLPVNSGLFSGTPLRLDLTGLTGGHSGVEIHKGRANANVLLGRALYTLHRSASLRLISLGGGLKDNAIPVQSSAEFLTDAPDEVSRICKELETVFRSEYAATDPNLSLTVCSGSDGVPMDEDSTARIICLLMNAPAGVQAMSADVEGLVQTSLNLGVLSCSEGQVSAAFCLRSSVESQKEAMTDQLVCLTESLGGRAVVSGDYPGWAYRRESPLRDLMIRVFTEQYGHPPVIDAVHAGLECGLFAGKLPGLDCVSIGPDLTDIHTYRERMNIPSVRRTWSLVTETLKQMK